jgi:hypothetical protein
MAISVKGIHSIRQIASVSMTEIDKRMNFAIFNADGIALNDHQIEVLQNSCHIQKLCQFHMLYDQLVSPLIFWTGSGGCSILQFEKPQGATTVIGKVLILSFCSRVTFLFVSLQLCRKNAIVLCMAA